MDSVIRHGVVKIPFILSYVVINGVYYKQKNARS